MKISCISLDMRRDVQEIFRSTPHEKQVMMFSATLSKEIRPVCKKFMQDVINSTYYTNSMLLSMFPILYIKSLLLEICLQKIVLSRVKRIKILWGLFNMLVKLHFEWIRRFKIHQMQDWWCLKWMRYQLTSWGKLLFYSQLKIVCSFWRDVCLWRKEFWKIGCYGSGGEGE